MGMFIEFHEWVDLFKLGIQHSRLPETGGADNLRDLSPISLMGSLCKLLAKVLASKLKKVVTFSQNASVKDVVSQLFPL